MWSDVSVLNLINAADGRIVTSNSPTELNSEANLTFDGSILVGVSANAEFTGTGYLKLPTGNTAQQPGSPTNNMLRYNNQTNKFEGYENAAWKNLVQESVGGISGSIQYNNAGILGGSSDLLWDEAFKKLTVRGKTIVDNEHLYLGIINSPTGATSRTFVLGDNTGTPVPGADTSLIYGKDESGVVKNFGRDETGAAYHLKTTLLEDLNPQMGGNLDTNNFNILTKPGTTNPGLIFGGLGSYPTNDSSGSVFYHTGRKRLVVSQNDNYRDLDYTTTPEEYDAKGDGVTDDSVAFQNAIDSINTAGGGVLKLAANKTYIIDQTLLCSNLVIEGQGNTSIIKFKASQPDLSWCLLANSKVRILLKDFKLDGNEVNQPTGYHGGFRTTTCTDIEIFNLEFVNGCDRAVDIRASSRIWIDYCRFLNNGVAVPTLNPGNAISVDVNGAVNCKDVFITNNYLENFGDAAIGCPSTHRLVIANNIVRGATDIGLTPFNIESGISFNGAQDVTCTGNVVRKCKIAGIIATDETDGGVFYPLRNIVISENVVVNAAGLNCRISLESTIASPRSYNWNIIGNTIDWGDNTTINSSPLTISGTEYRGVKINGNNIRADVLTSTQRGIWLTGSGDQYDVQHNTITNFHHGVETTSSVGLNGLVANNTCFNVTNPFNKQNGYLTQKAVISGDLLLGGSDNPVTGGNGAGSVMMTQQTSHVTPGAFMAGFYTLVDPSNTTHVYAVAEDGQRFTLSGHKTNATIAPNPAVDDVTNGFEVGSLFINATLDRPYICVDNTDGAAIYTELTQVSLIGQTYLTISGQVITVNAISLTANITGNLPVTNLNSGTGATAITFWAGDATWKTAKLEYDTVPKLAGNLDTDGFNIRTNTTLDNDFALQGYDTGGAAAFRRVINVVAGNPPRLEFPGPDQNFDYILVTNNLAADRQITLPILTTNDTFVFEAHAQTLTNKTINGSNNTITNISLTTGVTGVLPEANGGSKWTQTANVVHPNTSTEDVAVGGTSSANATFYVAANGVTTQKTTISASSATLHHIAGTVGALKVVHQQFVLGTGGIGLIGRNAADTLNATVHLIGLNASITVVSGLVLFVTNGVERCRVDGSGNLLIGGAVSPTGTATKVLQFGDNAGNPTPATNTACIFAKDDAGTVKLYGIDETGAAYLLGGSGVQIVSRTGTVVHPTTLTDDFAVGGTTSTSPLFFDESEDTLYIQGAVPKLIAASSTSTVTLSVENALTSASLSSNVPLNLSYSSNTLKLESSIATFLNVSIAVGNFTPDASIHTNGAGHFERQTNPFGTTSIYPCLMLGARGEDSSVMVGGRANASNAPFTLLGYSDTGAQRQIIIGGGQWNVPDATRIYLATCPTYNETTNQAIERMQIEPNGYISMGLLPGSSNANLEIRPLSATTVGFRIRQSNSPVNITPTVAYIECAYYDGNDWFEVEAISDHLPTVRLKDWEGASACEFRLRSDGPNNKAMIGTETDDEVEFRANATDVGGYSKFGLNLFSRTDANRGTPPSGDRVLIYNSDDSKINIWNGTNWTLADGTST